MNNLHRKSVLVAFLIASVMSVSACSTFTKAKGFLSEDSEIDYQNNQSVKLLEIPPGLTTPDFDRSLALPKGASGNNISKPDISPPSFNLSSPTNSSRTGVASSIVNTSGRTVLKVHSDYPNSLLATEANLKKMGFEIKSKTSSVISAKFKESAILVNETSVSKLLKHVVGRDGKRLVKYDVALDKNETYLVAVTNDANGPTVSFTRKDGKRISDEGHAKIIELLHTSFNS